MLIQGVTNKYTFIYFALS